MTTPYTVRQLITNGYYLTGIVSRSMQVLTGEQLFDGFQLLNELLAIKTADQRLIPYFEEYGFTAVPGQEKYFIPGLVVDETATFNIGDVRYSMMKCSRDKYFGTGRVDNINSLPYNWHVERVRGGANFYMYFNPASNYPVKIWGKFGLDEIGNYPGTNIPDYEFDLLTVYDMFYVTYLKFALAEYICSDYNIVFQPQSSQKLKELEYTLIDISPKDLSLTKLSTMQVDTGINYADVNIGRGWRPS
jgi:hypothetical protein